MDINKISSAVTADMGTTKSKSNTSQQHEVAELKTRKMPVQSTVSDDWKLIEKNQPNLADMDDFDAAKVAELRQALQNGTFSLDVKKIAEAMKQNHG
ncbi:flagellar biosynthesis anti-sigma factor FlgM [Shewanella sp. UCD-FRSSP16_17]|uniref:flagellar biosynthesis anti-sigma factor FlgM n=1 Tax=unclassified Shewanella TaxID=196818 RepID=UPI0007EED4EF|nr:MULTISPECIES: flagellar biosynthesis anti-sigma factor FlgM [unclassified Shewanella]MBQ4890134.1 flagellar biosynthesis anti-sigma factor FlgM [Shewanella sp. MMG014]OBT05314.1 flagellar biosynthesis anti-sigma factor FlgM [Shewanella sp. UCD-FRSSP16_17]